MRYSVVVPVFNRPDETDELLRSLCAQTQKDFEVIIVDDGSLPRCEKIVDGYGDRLDVKYFYKTNSGPGLSRNFGVERASGEYIVFLDSDVVLPEEYFSAVTAELEAEPADAFGGPDRAGDDFSAIQKAVNYSMTSFFTTGGIRGGGRKMDRFYPRSFNMGVRSDVFAFLGGFSDMRFGEDIELSLRIFKAGFRCRLFPGAWVWHRRRADFRKFFRQVYNSGIARINLYKKHKGSLKPVHVLPAAFTCCCALLLVFSVIFCSIIPLMPIMLYVLLLLFDSFRVNRSVRVALMSVPAAFVQLFGYGCGFIDAWVKRCILGRGEYVAFSNRFYK